MNFPGDCGRQNIPYHFNLSSSSVLSICSHPSSANLFILPSKLEMHSPCYNMIKGRAQQSGENGRKSEKKLPLLRHCERRTKALSPSPTLRSCAESCMRAGNAVRMGRYGTMRRSKAGSKRKVVDGIMKGRRCPRCTSPPPSDGVTIGVQDGFFRGK